MDVRRGEREYQYAVGHQVEVGPLPELAQVLLKVITDLLEHLEVPVGDIGVALTVGTGDREIGARRSVRKSTLHIRGVPSRPP